MKLGIDIDGCLANFNSAYIDALIAVGGNKFPENCKTDPTFPPVWDYDKQFGYTPEDTNKVWKRDIAKNTKFWLDLETLEHARETVKQLNRISRAGDDVYFLTTRMGIKAKQQTEDWLAALGMHTPTVLLTPHKLPVIIGLEIGFFIDDRLTTVQGVVKGIKGGSLPKGFKLFLRDAPYNVELNPDPGYIRVASVKEALEKEGLWIEERRGRPRKDAADE